MSTLTPGPVRVGTSEDPLAVARARSVVSALSSGSKNKPAVEAELVMVEGVLSPVQAVLAAGDIDVVVDSASNGEALNDSIVVAAFPKRGDSRDALCAADSLTFDTLAAGARVVVATDLRRAQVLARRSDLEVDVVEHNIAELLFAVESGEATATVVAAADLDRLGKLDAVTEFLGNDGWPTDAGQGALAVQVRRGSEKLVKALGHNPTRTIVEAERAVRDALGDAGALTGVHGIIDDGLLFLSARVYARDGSSRVTSSHALYLDDVAHPAAELAARVVDDLVSLGAHDLAAKTA
jgi:hydroxymethylbilane synthase